MFNPGELPLVLLALADVTPLKAYEFIADLERLLGPGYRPSPGGVYPALNALTAEGLLASDSDGRGKRYAITDVGRNALEVRQRQLAAFEQRTGARVRGEASLRPMLERFTERIMHTSGRVDPDAVAAVLDSAANKIEKLTGDKQ